MSFKIPSSEPAAALKFGSRAVRIWFGAILLDFFFLLSSPSLVFYGVWFCRTK